MIDQNKITAHPPQKAVQDFILEAEKKTKYVPEVVKSQNLPWKEKIIRDDVQKAFTVKLPEEYILKIKYISEKTNKSQQKIAREILVEEVDRLIKSLTH